MKKASKSCSVRVVQVKSATHLHSFNDDWRLNGIWAKNILKNAKNRKKFKKMHQSSKKALQKNYDVKVDTQSSYKTRRLPAFRLSLIKQYSTITKRSRDNQSNPFFWKLLIKWEIRAIKLIFIHEMWQIYQIRSEICELI
mgnify:CR=1 FL=1